MRKTQRAKIIIERLDELYPEPKIPLNHSNNFTLLIAVMLSAQCTDKKVNQVTSKLFKDASTPETMMSLGENVIYNYIKELGLAKQKASYAYLISKELCNNYSSTVPSSLDLLTSFPGVGHKTASVVMAQAFNIPSFPVDTHIHRLSQRWELTNGQNVKRTETDLKLIFPEQIWNKLHLQIIYYGREYCTARACMGLSCPICRELFPKRKLPVICKKA